MTFETCIARQPARSHSSKPTASRSPSGLRTPLADGPDHRPPARLGRVLVRALRAGTGSAGRCAARSGAAPPGPGRRRAWACLLACRHGVRMGGPVDARAGGPHPVSYQPTPAIPAGLWGSRLSAPAPAVSVRAVIARRRWQSAPAAIAHDASDCGRPPGRARWLSRGWHRGHHRESQGFPVTAPPASRRSRRSARASGGSPIRATAHGSTSCWPGPT